MDSDYPYWAGVCLPVLRDRLIEINVPAIEGICLGTGNSHDPSGEANDVCWKVGCCIRLSFMDLIAERVAWRTEKEGDL